MCPGGHKAKLATYAAILAAGRGSRFGGDKVTQRLGELPVWRHAYDCFAGVLGAPQVFVVVNEDNESEIERQGAPKTVRGGGTRQESTLAALHSLPEGAEFLLIHDAARPFVSAELIGRVLEATQREGAAGAAVGVFDTIRNLELAVVPRADLRAMQTPQGSRVDWLLEAYARAEGEFTDDLAVLQAAGFPVALVPGDSGNFKITEPADFLRAQQKLGLPETRTGLGYDIHSFSEDPDRQLWLGGVAFDGHRALEGHSDADVLLHAITDAILGAVGLGDIGLHFPPSDPQWKNQPSLTFVRFAAEKARERGWQIVNIDATVIAESPKVMPRAREICSAVAAAVGTQPGRISVKATTNERLGSIGRSEGIAAFAVATLRLD